MVSGGIFSIGHSTHSAEKFASLLNKNYINILIDVRSSPYSRFNPQFNRENLIKSLRKVGIKYAYFGNELGARVDDPQCYVDGKVQYARIAERDEFKQAIARLIKGATNYRIVLMCAEKEPLDCHRTILVSQQLEDMGCHVGHILADGSIEPHQKSLERLLEFTRTPGDDLFRSRDDLVKDALAKQEQRIAYQEAL